MLKELLYFVWSPVQMVRDFLGSKLPTAPLPHNNFIQNADGLNSAPSFSELKYSSLSRSSSSVEQDGAALSPHLSDIPRSVSTERTPLLAEAGEVKRQGADSSHLPREHKTPQTPPSQDDNRTGEDGAATGIERSLSYGRPTPISPDFRQQYLGSQIATIDGREPTRIDLEMLRKWRRIAVVASFVLLLASITLAAITFSSFGSSIGFILVLPTFYLGSAFIRFMCERRGRSNIGDNLRRSAPRIWQQTWYANSDDSTPRVDTSYFKYLALLVNCVVLGLGIYAQSSIALYDSFVLIGILANPIVQAVAIASSAIILFHVLFGWLKPVSPTSNPLGKTLEKVVVARRVLAKWLNKGKAVDPADVAEFLEKAEQRKARAAHFSGELISRLRDPNGEPRREEENSIFAEREQFVQAIHANQGQLDDLLQTHTPTNHEIEEVKEALEDLRALFENNEWMDGITYYAGTWVGNQHFHKQGTPVGDSENRRDLGKNHAPIWEIEKVEQAAIIGLQDAENQIDNNRAELWNDAKPDTGPDITVLNPSRPSSPSQPHPARDDYQLIKEFDRKDSSKKRAWIFENRLKIQSIFNNVATAEFDPDEKPTLSWIEKYLLPVFFTLFLMASTGILYAIFTGYISVSAALGPMAGAGILLFSAWFCAEKMRKNSTGGPYTSLLLLFSAATIVGITLLAALAVSNSTAVGLVPGLMQGWAWAITCFSAIFAMGFAYLAKGIFWKRGSKRKGYADKAPLDRAQERRSNKFYIFSKWFLRALNVGFCGFFAFTATASIFFMTGMGPLGGLDLQKWALTAAAALGGGTIEAQMQWFFMFGVPVLVFSLVGFVLSMKSLFEKSTSNIADLEGRDRVRRVIFSMVIWSFNIGIVIALIAMRNGFTFGAQPMLLYPILGMALMPILAYNASFGSLFDEKANMSSKLPGWLGLDANGKTAQFFNRLGRMLGVSARWITQTFNTFLGVTPFMGKGRAFKYIAREVLVLSILLIGSPMLLGLFGVPGASPFSAISALSQLVAHGFSAATITLAEQSALFLGIGALVTWLLRMRRIPAYRASAKNQDETPELASSLSVVSSVSDVRPVIHSPASESKVEVAHGVASHPDSSAGVASNTGDSKSANNIGNLDDSKGISHSDPNSGVGVMHGANDPAGIPGMGTASNAATEETKRTATTPSVPTATAIGSNVSAVDPTGPSANMPNSTRPGGGRRAGDLGGGRGKKGHNVDDDSSGGPSRVGVPGSGPSGGTHHTGDLGGPGFRKKDGGFGDGAAPAQAEGDEILADAPGDDRPPVPMPSVNEAKGDFDEPDRKGKKVGSDDDTLSIVSGNITPADITDGSAGDTAGIGQVGAMPSSDAMEVSSPTHSQIQIVLPGPTVDDGVPTPKAYTPIKFPDEKFENRPRLRPRGRGNSSMALTVNDAKDLEAAGEVLDREFVVQAGGLPSGVNNSSAPKVELKIGRLSPTAAHAGRVGIAFLPPPLITPGATPVAGVTPASDSKAPAKVAADTAAPSTDPPSSEANPPASGNKGI
jgi:hypothetical protein